VSSSACAHLHVHSEYSLLDGACKIEKLAERAAAYDQPALGLTDHGVMNGSVELFKACRKHGVKPILGLEAYFRDDRRDTDSRVKPNHLTLLAESDQGFRNLVKLTSLGFLEGLYRGKPTVDLELLSTYGEGVIAFSGCLAARASQHILDGQTAQARAHLDDLVQVFGPGDVYLEVQRNGLTEQEKVNAAMQGFATEMGLPLVATADVHYLGKEDHHHHAALLCVQTKSTLADPAMSFDHNEFYLKDNEEMATQFADMPGAVASTLEIAERCNTEIELGKRLIPTFKTPEEQPEGDYLRALVLDGLRERYGDPVPAAALERAEMELGVIGNMGFSGYFLIVWDFIRYAREHGIPVGPGRGSAAGSIVAYSLRITDVDPLRYDLLFERFLNPDRVSMPDIDIDFSVKGRDKVIAYVTEKYGRESVAQIVTFGKMLPRAAIKDSARVLGHDYATGDRLAKLVPDAIMGKTMPLEKCLAPGSELWNEYERDPISREVIDLAKGLEGTVRNAGIHAAAVVIADRPLTDIVPIQLADAGELDADGKKTYKLVTQYSMGPIEEIGLLKMDFLGLRNLDVIEAALDIIESSGGERPDMATLALDDAKTYEMLARGDSVGVFQMESEGMRKALVQVGPTEFDDLVALVALYRPGAMDQIPAYARGKKYPDMITFPDERLRPILANTKGVILYQEQSMQIAKTMAGFTAGKADDLRKAIGKKNLEKMAELKEPFVAGCRENAVAEQTIDWMWSTNEAAANYSFNRSHAACYALIAYQTAWLKANYPAEYMAALISSVMSTKDKVPFFVNQAEQMGIEILPPDVNESDHEFMVVDGTIRFGLDAVKGVGYASVEAIKAARAQDGPFTSLWDFCARVDCRAVNRKAIEALIKCGAFGSTRASRKGMLEVLEAAQSAGQQAQLDAQIGQGSIFDLAETEPAGSQPAFTRPSHPPIPLDEFDRQTLLAIEKESIGLFITEHPLKRIREALLHKADCSAAGVIEKKDGEWVKVGGMLTGIRKFRTRSGGQIMRATLDDLEGQVELLIFEKVMIAREKELQADSIVLVRGTVDHGDNQLCLKVADLEIYDPSDAEIVKAREAALKAAEPPPPLKLRLNAGQLPAGVIDDLKQVFADYPGESEVVLDIVTGQGQRRLKLGQDFRVAARNASLKAELDRLLGPTSAPPPPATAAPVSAAA
jgi:DNA polymerase-3 subunit alpha